MSERPPPSDDKDAHDSSPTVEVVEGDPQEVPVEGHAPTSQGLGFDTVAYLAGLAAEESKRAQSRSEEPPPSEQRRPSSRAPERPRQTLPTLGPSQGSQPHDRPLSRISTPEFGDIAGALAEAEAALTQAPADLEAERLVRALRTRLERAHEGRLAPLTRIVVMVDGASLEGLAHEARFLVDQVDGRSTIGQLVETKAMTRVDAMRVLAQLAELGVVRFR